MSAPAPPRPTTSPTPSRPPARGPLRTVGGAIVAILVVAVGIVLVNILHRPGSSSSATTAAASRTPVTTPAGGGVAAPATPAVTQAATATVAATQPSATSAASASRPPTAAAATGARPMADVVILNDSKIQNLAARASEIVADAGYHVVRIGSWGVGGPVVAQVPRTTVFYEGDALRPAAEAFARAIPGVDDVVKIEHGQFARPAGEEHDLLLVVTRYFPEPSPRP